MRMTYTKLVVGALVSFFLTYILSLRPFTPEFYVDPYTYVNLATKVDTESIDWVSIREPLFPLILNFLGLLVSDGHALYCIVQFLLIFSLVSLVNAPDVGIFRYLTCVALIITVPACFVMYVNLWRQFISVALVLLAINLRVGGWRRNLLFVLALMTHLSSGLLVALYWFFSNSSKDGWRFRLLVVSTFAVLMLGFGGVSSALGVFGDYAGDGEGTLARRIYLIVVALVAACFERDYFRRSLIVGLAVCVVSMFPNILFDRMSHMPIMFSFVSLAQNFRGWLGWLTCLSFVLVNSFIVTQTQSAKTVILGIYLGA